MYTYVKATSLKRTIGAQWSNEDIRTIPLNLLFYECSHVYLELSNPALSSHVYVNMNSYRTEFGSSPLTVQDWLIHIGSRTLTTVDSVPSTDVKYVKYNDAFRSKYKINRCKIGVNYPNNYPEEELKDLVLTRPEMPSVVPLLHKKCLITINGFVHMTDTDEFDECYVVDGASSMRARNDNQMGILSFEDFGDLRKVKIDPLTIRGQALNAPLRDRIYFDIPGNLDNKSYILVLGGIMFFVQPDVFWRSGTNTFALDINRINYTELLFDMEHFLDIASLGLLKEANNPNVWDTANIYSDAVIKKYLTMNQSFMVIVDKPLLLTNKIHVKYSSVPGHLRCYQEPVYPLVLGRGKIADYWKTYENDGIWSLRVTDPWYRHYINETIDEKRANKINAHLRPDRPFRYSKAFFLQIAGHNTI